MKLFSRFLGTDEEKVVLDRRLFLLGATVAASGLILPRLTILIPELIPERTWQPSHTRYYFIDSEHSGIDSYRDDGRHTINMSWIERPIYDCEDIRLVKSWEELNLVLPKRPPTDKIVIYRPRGMTSGEG